MREDTKAIYKYFNITYRFHINMLIVSPFNMNKYVIFLLQVSASNFYNGQKYDGYRYRKYLNWVTPSHLDILIYS